MVLSSEWIDAEQGGHGHWRQALTWRGRWRMRPSTTSSSVVRGWRRTRPLATSSDGGVDGGGCDHCRRAPAWGVDDGGLGRRRRAPLWRGRWRMRPPVMSSGVRRGRWDHRQRYLGARLLIPCKYHLYVVGIA
uniref:Uncharacterized protein n=1 Tax=Oryza barthii TaxID=65489 RepID=A0A0D3H7X6_9ORYZ